MPAFSHQNGPRLQISLKSQAKRTALSANVFDDFGGEKRARPLQSRENGSDSGRQLQKRDGNGVVGSSSMEERLRLAEKAGPYNLQNHSTHLDQTTSEVGSKRSVTPSGTNLANGGRVSGGTKAEGSGVLQPVEVSMYNDIPHPGVGLVNLGNTCYLNSVLQCLLHTRPLHNLLYERHHSNHCEYAPNRSEGFCPMCLLERRLRTSFYNEPKHPRPLVIAKNLHHFAPQLRVGDQEDAHELLRLIIDSCHRTCLLQQRGLPMTALKRFEDRTGKVPTVISDIFGGTLQSQVKCLGCGFESNKRDVFMDLSLDLAPSTHSVYAALQSFIQPEKLDGANRYRCDRCKKLQPARKQMQILRAPNVLVIQLKRFENICGGKITRHVHFKETLSLAGLMAPGSRDPPPEYTLYALIVHEGSTQQLGHYYACAKVNRCWYLFNDSNVRSMQWGEVSRQGAYILFYLKTRPPGAVFFYPPKSQDFGQGAVKESPAPVCGPQLPPGYRGPVEPQRNAETRRLEGRNGSVAEPTGPLIGPQLPPGYRGPVGSEASAGRERLGAGTSSAAEPAGPLEGAQVPTGCGGPVEAEANGNAGQADPGTSAAAEPAGPLFGPGFPGGYQGPVILNANAETATAAGYGGPVTSDAVAETVRRKAGSISAAPPTGPICGAQLPPAHRGLVGSDIGAGVQQTKVGSSPPAPPTGPVYGPQLPGPAVTVRDTAVAVIDSRIEQCAALTGPPNRGQTSLGPVAAIAAVDQSKRESSSQMHQPPAGPASQPPPPPETPPLPQGPVSQAVAVEANPDARSEGARAGPLPSVGQPMRDESQKLTKSDLYREREITELQTEGRADCVVVNGAAGVAGQSSGELLRGDDVSMSGAGAGAAVECEPHDLKRRLSDAAAVGAPDAKRRSSEPDGQRRSSETERGDVDRVSARGRTDERPPSGGLRESPKMDTRDAAIGVGICEVVSSAGNDIVSRCLQSGDCPMGCATASNEEGFWTSGGTSANGGEQKSVAVNPPPTDGGSGVVGVVVEMLQPEVAERVGGLVGEANVGGRVKVMDPSAWSLAYSYGSDEEEEREETAGRSASLGPSGLSCNKLAVQERVVAQSFEINVKPLPGLVEAELLLKEGAGMCIFGRSGS